MGELQLAFNFQTVDCGTCGTTFAMTLNRYRKSKDDGVEFYCPNGHRLYFTEWNSEKLKRELELEKKRHEWTKQDLESTRKSRNRQEHRANAFKGVITKTKKRIGNGICPCCNRTFQNVMAHMKTKHPKYKGKKK